MKKRKGTYVLIGVVAVIWGILVVQLIGGFTSEPSVVQNAMSSSFQPPTPQAKESFELLPITTDPFLGTAITNEKASKSSKGGSKPAKEIAWPNVSYHGWVSNGKKAKVYILSINGQQHLMKRGQEIAGVRLISGTATKARLRYQQQTKEITLP